MASATPLRNSPAASGPRDAVEPATTPERMELWHLDPARAIRCLHCDGPQVVNAAAGQSWQVYGTSYALLRCNECAGLFTFPSPTLETLNQLYKENFAYKWYRDHYPAKFLDSLHRMVQYRQIGALKKGRLKILDYGGGVGYFSKAARLLGHDAETRDPMFERIESGSQAASAAPDAYDVVACHHVLEHAIEPLAMLRDIHDRLRPGGTLIVAVPNAISAGYQRRGVHWTWSQPPLIHLHHVSPVGLRSLLERAGFRVTQEHFFDRWDASTLADVKLAEQFVAFDSRWGKTRLQWATAQWNSLRRYLALAASELVVRPQPAERAELLMVAERPEARTSLT